MKANNSPFSFFWKSAILGVVLLINLVLAYRLFWGEQGITPWQDLQHLQAELMEQKSQFEGKQSEISREIRLLHTDDAYVEKIIRKRLNYVRGNEILYLFDAPRPEDEIWTGADANDG